MSELVKSKRFWVSLFGLITIILSALVPQLADKFNTIVPSVILIVGVAVGGYSVEDAITAWNGGSDPQPPAPPSVG